MTHARDGPDLITHWITLVDAAQYRLDTFDASDRSALDQVGYLIDALLSYEHSLTPLQRYEARLALWKRDHPDRPLPDMDWSLCQCRTCQRARYLQRARPAAWQVQVRVLARQRQKGTPS